MTYDLVPRTSDFVTPAGRSTIRVLSREARDVERRSAIRQLHEQARAELAQLRVNNGVALAAHAAIGIAGLDGLITAVSADKPCLELELRQLQRVVGVGVAGTIMNYMMGT